MIRIRIIIYECSSCYHYYHKITMVNMSNNYFLLVMFYHYCGYKCSMVHDSQSSKYTQGVKDIQKELKYLAHPCHLIRMHSASATVSSLLLL